MSEDIYSRFFCETPGDKKLYYILYQITNLINNKIYVGKHVTKNQDDGYMGSGKLIQQAIEKYGRENFRKDILLECLTLDELNAAEQQIVTPEFVAREDTYNLALGGGGGWYHVNIDNRPDNKFRGKTHTDETKAKLSAKLAGRKYPGRKHPLSDDGRKRIGESASKRLKGVPKSEETKKKISDSLSGKTVSDPDLLEKKRQDMERVRSLKPAVVSADTKKKLSESLKASYANGTRKKKDWSILEVDIENGLTATEIEKKHSLWRGAVRSAYKSGNLSRMPNRH
jgi:group I intron endonuclease